MSSGEREEDEVAGPRSEAPMVLKSGPEELRGELVSTSSATPARTSAEAIDFADHQGFHETVGKAVLGGAVGGALAYLFGSMALPAGPAFTLAVSTGTFALIAATRRRWQEAALGGLLGIAGGVLSVLASPYPLFAGALLGASAAPILAKGESWKRKLVTAGVAGAFGSAGLFVAEWMMKVGLFRGILPEPLAMAAAGGAVGLFFGLASVTRHVARPRDPVESAYLEALQLKDGELHEMLERALAIHRAVRADLEEKRGEKTVETLSRRVGELAMRILSIAGECRRIERDLGAAPASELDERIAQLRRRADAATDEAARETYLSAIESLDGQRRAFDAINRGRERVVARLHANVALLEKVRFSLLHLRSADAERIGGESSPLLDALEELSRELDATSTAVGEVFGRSGERRALKSPPASAALPTPAPEAMPTKELSERSERAEDLAG